MGTHSPSEAKSIGRRVVVRASVQKFCKEHRAALLETAGKLIVEASPDDLVWGVGHYESDPRAWKPSAWRGRNLLGFALTGARHLLSVRP